MGFFIILLIIVVLLVIGSLSKGRGNKATSAKTRSTRSRQYSNRDKKQLSDDSDKFWIPKNKAVKINGYELAEGLIYFGTNLSKVSRYYDSNIEPALINPQLPINKQSPDYSGTTLGYWPSYSELSPRARAAYLEWLANGKKDLNAPIGFVFLYFYGLERRVLNDLQNRNNQDGEIKIIRNEVGRLFKIYGDNSSFNRYASQFIELLELFDKEESNFKNALKKEDLDFENYSSARHGYYALGLNFKKGLAHYSINNIPLPADWALKWAVKNTNLNTPARRCKSKFQDLYRIFYQDNYDEGLILGDYKETLTFQYSPASSSLYGKDFHITTNIPEFEYTNDSLTKCKKLIDICTDKLDPYSRHLGRNPGDEDSTEAISNLPQELIADYLSPKIQDFANQIKEQLENQQYALLSTNNFTDHWEIKGVNKYRKKESIEIAQFFFKLGFGIEPDLRFGSAKFERDSKVVFFKIDPDNYPLAPSKEYKLALLILQLTTVVGLADGTFSEEEERYLDEYIENLFQLSEAEKKRLNAYLFWLKVENPGVRGIKKKISDLKMDKRKSILDFLIKVANADGYVDPEEVKLLQKTAEIFELEPDQIYHDIHSQQAADHDPVLVMKGEDHKGYSIPDEEEKKKSTQELDEKHIKKVLDDTKKVHDILGDIFEGEDEEPEDEKQESIGETLLGLGELHSELVVKLLEKDEWTQMEFENICSELNLFPGGAKELINDKAFEVYDDALILDFEVIEINTEIAKDIKL